MGERVYTLLYADDMVLLAEEEEEMRSMMGRLEEYLDRKAGCLAVREIWKTGNCQGIL